MIEQFIYLSLINQRMLFNVSIYVLITHSSNVSNCQGQMIDPSTKRRIFSSVSALGGAGASVLDSVEALSDLLLVAGTEAEHTAASVQLVAHVLVHLAEFIELASDIVVLDLDDLCVLLECVLLSEEVDVLATEDGVGGLVGVQIFPLQVELILAVLQACLKFSHLSCHVQVACILKLVLLTQLVQVAHLLVSVSAQQCTVVSKTGVQVLSSGDLLLDIIK
jgi:hypothetical protein